MSDEHGLIIIVVGIMARLDRLERQVEAVCATIRLEVAHTQDERDDIRRVEREPATGG